MTKEQAKTRLIKSFIDVLIDVIWHGRTDVGVGAWNKWLGEKINFYRG